VLQASNAVGGCKLHGEAWLRTGENREDNPRIGVFFSKGMMSQIFGTSSEVLGAKRLEWGFEEIMFISRNINGPLLIQPPPP
jgi:hypothetical protein